VLRKSFKRELMRNLLNQSINITSLRDPSDGIIEDEIIAVTLRIVIDVQKKMPEYQRT